MDKDSGFTSLSIFAVETYQPLDACPRITMFHHAIAKDRTYFYEGRRRTHAPSSTIGSPRMVRCLRYPGSTPYVRLRYPYVI